MLSNANCSKFIIPQRNLSNKLTYMSKIVICRDIKYKEYWDIVKSRLANKFKERDFEFVLSLNNKIKSDILIYDMNSPSREKIRYLKELRKCNPETPIIVLLMFQDAFYKELILDVGTTSCLWKTDIPDKLEQEIRMIKKKVNPKCLML